MDNKTELQKKFERQTPTIKDVGTVEYLQTFVSWLHLQVELLQGQLKVYGMDYKDGNSQGAFTVFKNGKLHLIKTNSWKAKLYLIWCRIKDIKILKEVN